MPRILVVEDSRTQALQIQLLLEDGGYEVSLAENGREALEVLKQGLPDIVLTDLSMPEMNGLELVEAVRQKYPGLPIVLMTAMGSEEIAVQALKAGAASYVPKKNLNQDILSTLESILEVAQASRQEERVLGCLANADFRFVLDNDVTLVSPLIGYLEESVASMQHCDRTGLMRVGVALHEALVNAIQHGNLEVSSELRQEDDEAFRRLTEERRHQLPYNKRRVYVHVLLSLEESVYIIKDEGSGFDPSSLPDPTDPANLERIGGRGLMLIRTFMDRVEFNETGNQITMINRHRGNTKC